MSYGYPPAPSQPPTPVDTQATADASVISSTAGSQHPGWLARSLFWAALVVGGLPAIVLAPLLSAGQQNSLVLYSVGTIVGGCLRLILGAIAILLVKNTTWVRRIVGAAIFVLGCLALLVLSPLMSMVVSMSEAGPADSMLAMAIVQGAVSSVYLSALFCGWNIARNRRWWILVIAVAIAVVLNIFNTVVNQMLAAHLAGGVAVTVVFQAIWLVVVFGVLGLCHLLGRVRSGTVPVTSQPNSIPQQGYAPQSHPHTEQTAQTYQNQWPPGPELWSNTRH